MQYVNLPINGDNISFIFLAISFGIIGYLYAFHNKYSKEFILSAFGQRYANQYLRDDNVFKRRVSILFSFLMILNISFFIWSTEETEQNNLSYLGKILLFTITYYLIKYLVIWFLGYLLKMKQISTIAVFFTTLFDKVFALFSFPFLIVFHFFSTDIAGFSEVSIFSILILFFTLKIFWVIKIGIKSFGLSSFYLFLYICILEFFPLLLVYRELVFA